MLLTSFLAFGASCDDLDVLAVLKWVQREEQPKIQAKAFNPVARGDVLRRCGGRVMPPGEKFGHRLTDHFETAALVEPRTCW